MEFSGQPKHSLLWGQHCVCWWPSNIRCIISASTMKTRTVSNIPIHIYIYTYIYILIYYSVVKHLNDSLINSHIAGLLSRCKLYSHSNSDYSLFDTYVFIPMCHYYDVLILFTYFTIIFWFLSGVPDLFDRNKILSGGDLSHYQVPHCIRVFFYFVWFVFIHHNFQFYFELCTYCNILDIYLS